MTKAKSNNTYPKNYDEKGSITLGYDIEAKFIVECCVNVSGENSVNIQYVFLKDDLVYNITCSASYNSFPEYKVLFDEAAKSFNFE